MFQTVEMPVWALVLLVGFATVTFASHFLFPSVRWFFRRRLERAVKRLNERLQRPIEPFKLARRYDMIQRLIYDPEVSRAIANHAKARGVPENVAFARARGYAREIVPSFSAYAYFGVAIRLGKWVSQALYHVRLGHFDDDALSGIDRNATVVFVMNHRSNMDYVLVTWLAAERSALSYAVGEWARVWPLSRLIKAMGAFFIRRRERDSLYARVLARYVGMATDGGVTQAVFPEGRLSLDGAPQVPRHGLIKYIVEERDPKARDVVFVPVALNYDRVFEDRLLIAARQNGGRRFPARISVIARFILWQGVLKLRGRYHRHGYAAVSFGAPMSLRTFQAEHPGADARGLTRALMARIKSEAPVLPVPLVARVLLQADGPLDQPAIATEIGRMLGTLRRANPYVPEADPERAARFGLRILCDRGLVEPRSAGLAIVEAQRPLVTYYAASIAHLFQARSAA